ncbi:hypothetical protein Tel_02885 [Candidatus Tenderia electrophaga]|jgi:glycosyltransferase involved in cell wall biosynthesis|uniref:Glycosyl transferase family 1 n=1 Tax=Candidatus Tenderia electrophaga TaxID=1748243 RepID=A0A0S2TAJ5_9GAMM|nr:hypothetical protein Tel_02885 [Candidatus Tenderia electrophaga]
MRVLELCTSPDSGGLELYMVRTSAALKAAGDEVLAIVGPASRIVEGLRRHEIDTEAIKVLFAPLPLAAAKRLSKLIDTKRIDVVHVHWGKDLALAALAKRSSTRAPRLVYTRHMQITRAKKDIYHRWLYAQIDRLLTITDAMNAKVRQCLAPRMAERVHTLYHGVAGVDSPITAEQRHRLRSTWFVPDAAILVGVFSRLERPKGQHLLLEALCQARDEGLPLYALVVGHTMDAQYVAELKSRVREYGLDDRIHFEGFTDNVQCWMQACDIVALTTWEETFGLVLVEAMRAGVAVIGSDRGGVPEIVHHDKNGLLFRSFDADDFYIKVRRLAVDADLRKRLALAGKRDADERFNQEGHFNLLRKHLHGHPEPVPGASIGFGTKSDA